MSGPPRHIESAQRRKKGEAQVPVVRLIHMSSSSSPSPSPRSAFSSDWFATGLVAVRSSAIRANIASISSATSFGSPATPSNLYMFTPCSLRNFNATSLNTLRYLVPARLNASVFKAAFQFVSSPCRFPNFTRSACGWPYPPQGDSQTPVPAPKDLAFAAMLSNRLGNRSWSNSHRDRVLSQPSSHRKELNLTPRFLTSSLPNTSTRC
mmetsp:Transcript_771/g.1665  ORF Transcript_771/g.1665 Transcript_771/m.1665 type:complete len:208 (+) Transcript_771:277-900(+)